MKRTEYKKFYAQFLSKAIFPFEYELQRKRSRFCTQFGVNAW